MSYSFPSAFTTFDPSKAFSGGYGDFSSSGKLTSGSGSNMLGPALGFAGSIGSSIIGGLFGDQQANAQMAMQNAIANQQIIEGRNLGYGQIASNIGGRVFGATVASDLDLRRQQFAKEFEYGRLADLALARKTEENKRDLLKRTSLPFKEAASFENLLNMKRLGFQAALPGELAFGPTSFSRRFTNV